MQYIRGIFKQKKQEQKFLLLLYGRGDKIRTCDPIVPNDVRYQTALHLDKNSPDYSGLLMAEE